MLSPRRPPPVPPVRMLPHEVPLEVGCAGMGAGAASCRCTARFFSRSYADSRSTVFSYTPATIEFCIASSHFGDRLLHIQLGIRAESFRRGPHRLLILRCERPQRMLHSIAKLPQH